MLARPSFLPLIVIPSARAAISRTMSGIAAIGVAVLALLDEPGVLGEAAGVEEERQAVSVADLAHGAQVRQRHRLAAPGVVRDRHEHDRHVLAAALADQRVERVDVHVALERVDRRRLTALGDDAVDRLGARELDVGAGRVEVGVRRDDLARARR
jgi:hypothetical protein